jgi:hypothetical protein
MTERRLANLRPGPIFGGQLSHRIAGIELLPVWWTPSLSRRGDPLEFHRADIANGRVAPGRVVDAFDIVEHISPGQMSCPVDLAGDTLGFER